MTKRIIIFCVALVLFPFVPLVAQTITQYRYWLDNDYENRVEEISSDTEVSFEFATKDLAAGMHYINFCAQNSDYKWTKLKRFVFYKPLVVNEIAEDAQPTLTRYIYWLDDEEKKEATFSGNDVTFELSIDELPAGMHYLNYCAQNSNGKWTKLKRFVFYKPVKQQSSFGMMEYEYWIDGDTENVNSVISAKDELILEVSTHGLDEGIHYLSVRHRPYGGEWSETKVHEFYKELPEINICQPVRFTYDGTKMLTLASETPNASIFYRIEGRTTDFVPYQNPLTLTDSRRIEAFAKADGWENSDTLSFAPDNFRCSAVSISFAEPWLMIGGAKTGETIHYTVNGTTAVYSEPVEITEPCTVEAYSQKPYFNNSDTAFYEVTRCSDVVINYADGRASLECATAGAVIYYTIDSSDPDIASEIYTGPFDCGIATTIKAVAYKAGALHSAITKYTIETNCAPTPEIACDGQTITVTCDDDGVLLTIFANGKEVRQGMAEEISDITIDELMNAVYGQGEAGELYIHATSSSDGLADGVSETYRLPAYCRWTPDDTLESYVFVADSMSFSLKGSLNESRKLHTMRIHGALGSKDVTAIVTLNPVYIDLSDAEPVALPCNAFERMTNLAAVRWNDKTVVETIGNRNPNLLFYCTDRSLAPADVRNVIVNGVAERITLETPDDEQIQSSHCNFYCPEPFSVRRISYEHTFGMHSGLRYSEGWETIALPFDVQNIYNKTKGTGIIPFSQYDRSAGANGATPFWLYESDGRFFVPASAIEAYKPYIISMPNNKEYLEQFNIPGEVTFYAEGIVVGPAQVRQSALIPAMTHVEASHKVMAINKYQAMDGYREGSVFVADLRDVRPFESYMLSDDPQRRVIDIRSMMDDADDIKTILAPDIPNAYGTYNLQGQKVDDSYKGIVIKNGKKLIVR